MWYLIFVRGLVKSVCVYLASSEFVRLCRGFYRLLDEEEVVVSAFCKQLEVFCPSSSQRLSAM